MRRPSRLSETGAALGRATARIRVGEGPGLDGTAAPLDRCVVVAAVPPAGGVSVASGAGGGHQPAEQLVAEVSRAKWDQLLRVHRGRLPRPDLEDCLQQATLELVVQARRGSVAADAQIIAGALQHKFRSRIIDRQRALGGRSPATQANAHATSIDALDGVIPGDHDTPREVIAREELRRITSRLRDLTPDQRLVLANQTFVHLTPAEFCQQHGWTLEKHRKVAQRGRARLEQLLDDREPQQKTATRQAVRRDPALHPAAAGRAPAPQPAARPAGDHDPSRPAKENPTMPTPDELTVEQLRNVDATLGAARTAVLENQLAIAQAQADQAATLLEQIRDPRAEYVRQLVGELDPGQERTPDQLADVADELDHEAFLAGRDARAIAAKVRDRERERGDSALESPWNPPYEPDPWEEREHAAQEAEAALYDQARDAGLAPAAADAYAVVARPQANRPTAAAQLAQGDPLAPHRRALGDERSNRIAELATAAAAGTAAQTRADLLAQRDAAAPAWERLDRAGAYATRSVQTDRQTATTRAQEHLAAAEELTQRAGQTRGVRGRVERRTLEQAAANRRDIAGAEQLEIERLTHAEQDLHDNGRHLDDWIATDGGHAAVWVAAERELANRREHDIAARVDLAATQPPDHVRERIGDPPNPAAPNRAEWEALARRLEHDRLEAQSAVTDGSQPARDAAQARDVDRRVHRLRRDQGLDPPGRDQQHDIGIEA